MLKKRKKEIKIKQKEKLFFKCFTAIMVYKKNN